MAHKLMLDLPSCLKTPRLLVRAYQTDDGPMYLAVCQRNREHLLPYEKGNPALKVQTLEDAQVLVRQFAADWTARNAFFFGAFRRSDGAFTAQIYLGPVNWDLPEFALGYFADRDQQRQGFVTEAAQAVLRLAFDDLGAQRVRLGTNELNLASQRVAERCGFVREGHLRQTQTSVRHPDGRCSGEFLYGLLREEYLARPAAG